MRIKQSTLTQGVIWKQLSIFALPILISNLLQQVYSMTDLIIVGNYIGKESLAAVGASYALINMIVGFFLGLSAGAGVIVAQYYGSNDEENVQKTVHTAIAMCIVSGILLTVLGIIMSPWLLKIMNTPEHLLPLANMYLQSYFLGMLGLVMYNLGSGILRGVGDSFRPLLFLIVTVILNTVITVTFVVVFKWGVAGVGLATAIAQIVSALLVLMLLMHTSESYKVKLSKIRFHKESLMKIFKIGLPTGLQSLIVSFSNVLIQSSVNGLGENAMAAATAASKIGGFVYMPIAAFGIAITTFVGQNVGAKQFERVKKGVNTCLVMSLSITIIIAIIINIFDREILAMFVKDAEVTLLGSEVIRIITSTYFIFAATEVLSGAIRGAGKAHVPMFVTLAMLCGFRIIWILFIVPLNSNISMVHLCYPISWVLSTLALLWYYYKGNITNQEVM